MALEWPPVRSNLPAARYQADGVLVRRDWRPIANPVIAVNEHAHTEMDDQNSGMSTLGSERKMSGNSPVIDEHSRSVDSAADD